jgi:hypothetical protein
MAGQTKAGPPAWWVVQQHDEISVTQSSSMPETSVKKGERKKAAFGPYKSQAEADARAQEMSSRTLRVMAGGA